MSWVGCLAPCLSRSSFLIFNLEWPNNTSPDWQEDVADSRTNSALQALQMYNFVIWDNYIDDFTTVWLPLGSRLAMINWLLTNPLNISVRKNERVSWQWRSRQLIQLSGCSSSMSYLVFSHSNIGWWPERGFWGKVGETGSSGIKLDHCLGQPNIVK